MPLLDGFRNDDDLFKESTMTFGQHLDELRTTLIKAIMGLTLGFLVGLYIGEDVVKFFEQPITEALSRFYDSTGKSSGDYIGSRHFINPTDLAALLKGKFVLTPVQVAEAAKTDAAKPETPTSDVIDGSLLVPITLYELKTDSTKIRPGTLNPQEAFMIYMKAAFIAAIVLSSPWVFYQIWMFIAAGLYPHEKKYVHIFLPISLILFFAGASLAFFAVFRFVLDFLFWFNKEMNLNPEVRISEWLSFVLMLPVGFGVAFQLPLVMLFMERIHVVSVEKYLKNWRIAIMVIFVISMVLTPADPYSMLLMALPLCLLYYLGIGFCKWMPRIESPFAIEEREREKMNA